MPDREVTAAGNALAHVVQFALIEFHIDAAMETGDLAFDGS